MTLDYVVLAKAVVDMIGTPSYVANEVAKIFEDTGVEYAVCGGVALATYNYNRSTEDVDFLVSKKGFNRIVKYLVGKGFTFKQGSKRNLYYHGATKRVSVDLLVEGDVENKVKLPSPYIIREKRNGIYFVNLHALIAMKLLSGRDRDISDVKVLIKENDLDINFFMNTNFVERIEDKETVRKYQNAWREVHVHD
jgi:hypothetical protein